VAGVVAATTLPARPGRGFQVRALYLASQHRDLVAKNEDFDLVGSFAAGQQEYQLQCLSEEQVPKRQDHDHDHAHERR